MDRIIHVHSCSDSSQTIHSICLFTSIQANFKKPMKEQREVFNNIIEDWKGKLEQIDDILLMGIKI